MTLEDVENLKSPGDFILGLGDYIVDPNLGGLSPENFEHAPPLVEGILYLKAFDLTVATSGIYKWFIETHREYPELAVFFDAIGAVRAAKYVRTAIALFPNHEVPEDLDERFDLCDEHEDELDRLDRRFKTATTDAISKLRTYIKLHRKEFETQVAEFHKIRKR